MYMTSSENLQFYDFFYEVGATTTEITDVWEAAEALEDIEVSQTPRGKLYNTHKLLCRYYGNCIAGTICERTRPLI